MQRHNWDRVWSEVRSRAKANESEKSIGKRFDAISHYQVLILFGAPGLGKTYELRRSYEYDLSKSKSASFIYLRQITTEADLDALLIGCAEYSQWNLSNDDWTIYFDGFDEALADGEQIAQWIASRLQRITQNIAARKSRLKIRISSRPMGWSQTLQRELEAIWGESSVGVFTLEPLTESDIVLATNEGNEFLVRARQLGLEAFTQIPITLQFLIRVYEAHGHLPDRIGQLYYDGIASGLTARGPISSKGISEQIIVLGRIAAASMLCGRPRIWTGLHKSEKPENAISVNELAGGTESLPEGEISVGEREIREAIGRGPFHTTTTDIHDWIHLTIAEYLAAYYLATNIKDPKKLGRLLFVKQGKQQRVVPQLHEVAAWLASLRSDFCGDLIEADPDILLKSDVAALSDTDKQKLLSELLKKFSEYSIHDSWSDPRVSYKDLEFPGIADQLRKYIADNQSNIVARRFAIEVAEKCKLKELLGELFEVASDKLESAHLRARAISAISSIEEPKNRLALKGILFDGLENDEDGEIKASLLRGLWPENLTYKELYSVLTPQKSRSFIGMYWLFLRELTPKFKDAKEAGVGVDWAARNLNSDLEDNQLRNLVIRTMMAAWKFSEDESVLAKFATLYIAAAENHFTQISQSEFSEFLKLFFKSQWAVRLNLFEKIVKSPKFDVWHVTYAGSVWPILDARDIDRIVEELKSGSERVAKAIFLDLLIGFTFGKSDDEVIKVWNAADEIHELKERLTSANFVELNSEYATWAREDHKRRQKNASATQVAKKNPIDDWLPKLKEDPSLWWRFELALLQTGNRSHIDELKADISDTEFWRQAPPSQIAELHAAAIKYLKNAQVLGDRSWVGTTTWFRPSAAGYRVFRLLYGTDREAYERIPAEVWGEWAGAILSFTTNDGASEISVQSEIAAECQKQAPKKFEEALQTIFARGNFPVGMNEIVVRTLNENTREIIWSALLTTTSEHHLAEGLTKTIVESAFPPAIEVARSVLQGANIVANLQKPNIGIAAAAAYVNSNPDHAWPLLASLFERSPEVVKSILIWLADRVWDFAGTALQSLSERRLGDLYRWINLLGIVERENSNEAHFVGPIDKLVEIRRRAIALLTKRGSEEAVREIDTLTSDFPKEPWLKYRLEEAKAAVRRDSWHPITPREFLLELVGIDTATSFTSLKKSIQIKADVSRSITSSVQKHSVVGAQHAPQNDAESFILPKDKVEPADEPVEPKAKVRRFLFVASEWFSGHGGLSTLNREFCKALCDLGCKVTCLVPSASEDEFAMAKEVGVDLVTAPESVGLSDLERLLIWEPDKDFLPDIVVGHDQVTGKYGRRWAEKLHCSYAHVLHTVPEEIEKHKGAHIIEGKWNFKGFEKSKNQKELCQHSDIVVAVGPKIAASIKARIPHIEVHELVPGYGSIQFYTVSPGKMAYRVLFFGRMEDPNLKGLDIFLEIVRKFENWKVGIHPPQFVVRGVDEEGKISKESGYLEKFKELSESLNLAPYSDDIGEIEDEVMGASCILMPSRSEGFGLVGLEALAGGRPFIVSSASGLGEALLEYQKPGEAPTEYGAECVLDLSKDVGKAADVWAEKIKKILLSRDAELARASARREYFRDLFNWPAAARRFLEAVNEHLSSGKPKG
jgi:glycosyltransferase involved in cell wall biosynthesis